MRILCIFIIFCVNRSLLPVLIPPRALIPSRPHPAPRAHPERSEGSHKTNGAGLNGILRSLRFLRMSGRCVIPSRSLMLSVAKHPVKRTEAGFNGILRSLRFLRMSGRCVIPPVL